VSKQIIITVYPDGKSEITVKNVKGSDCLALTRPYEAALGPVLHRQKTADFFETEPVAIKTKQGDG